jgi:MFS transporter, AAHS family, 4-hydroxybenzoate transporter
MKSIQQLLESAPLSRTQVVAISLTAAINAIDAYDVLSMSFVAPVLAKQWGIDKATLGLVLSSGFAGMIAGSFFLSPLADRFGRRPLMLSTLALMSFGMVMAAFATSASLLSLWRVITGLGIGALVPVNTPLAVEYSNEAKRRMSLAIMSIGFPLGGTVGGLVASALIARASWQSVFLVGGAASAILLLASIRWLPEPPAFLLAKRPRGALARLNDYLVRCNQLPLQALPEPEKASPVGRIIFTGEPRRRLFLLSAANFALLLTVYYVISWMPVLITELGYSGTFAAAASATSTLFGVAGILLVGAFVKRLSQRLVAQVNLFLLAGLTIVFGLGSFSSIALLLLAALIGATLYPGGVALYGVIIDAFGPATRATGIGIAMSMGRVAGAIAPALAGYMMSIGSTRSAVTVTMAMGALVSAILLWRSERSMIADQHAF